MDDLMRQRLGDVIKHFAFDRKEETKAALHDVLIQKSQEIINNFKPVEQMPEDLIDDDIDLDN